jgi:hypothetical protein
MPPMNSKKTSATFCVGLTLAGGFETMAANTRQALDLLPAMDGEVKAQGDAANEPGKRNRPTVETDLLDRRARIRSRSAHPATRVAASRFSRSSASLPK